MKKTLAYLFVIATLWVFCGCNSAADRGAENVYNYAQLGGDSLYVYVITKPNRWFYATSQTPMTSATELCPTCWSFSTTQPTVLTQYPLDTLPVEHVLLSDLPQSLQNALQQ